MHLTYVVVCLSMFVVSQVGALEFHVAPEGNDGAPGSPDQPFATITRAQGAVRDARAGFGADTQPITVILHGGTYRLTEPLLFTPLDSGAPGNPVTYRSQEGEQAVVSGGVEVTGWRAQDDGVFIADVPWAADQPEPFTQLFVNGARRSRARTPNEGEYFYSKRLHMEGDVSVGLSFSDDDLGPWAEGGVICLFHNWVNSYNRIGEANWEARRLTFQRPAGIFFLGPSVRYYIENVFEALDAPGEWYLDHAAGRLYYYPLPDEDMVTAEVIAPALPSPMIELRGEPRLGLYVEHLRFEGISFQHADADLSADYAHSVQGANTQRGALVATGARNCTIEGCEFTHLGEHAVSLLESCVENTITRCHMHDLGGGGVYLSDAAPWSTNESYLTAHNVVDNNFIHDGGKIFRAGCGVFLGGSASYNQITHNEVCDMSWMGVHLGWSWTGLQPAYTHDNEVAYNHLHHLGNGVLNDIGGIYTLGVSPGTVLHHNLIHDVTRFERGDEGYGGWGIYLDAGSSEILVENNVVYNTRDGGLHVHNFGQPYGDTIRNNIFAYSAEGQMMRNADHEPAGNHVNIERNIVYGANERMLWGNNWNPDSHFTADRNLYWSEATDSPDFNGLTFAEWQATARDVNSVVADPGFVDAPGHDFTLRDGSPALALGFEPIDISSAGLYGDDGWTRLPLSITHRVVETAPPPEETPGSVSIDFADYEVGETPDGGVAADGPTRVSIIKDLSATGSRCVRFEDGPTADAWKPHWFTRRTAGVGSVRLVCVVRNDAEQPVSFDLEVRDWPRMAGVVYSTGPQLRFEPDGTLLAADGPEWATIGSYELGEWVQVEVVFNEGEGRDGTYSVRLGEEADVTGGLAFRGEAFMDANWVGFAGQSSDRGAFYVDELRVE